MRLNGKHLVCAVTMTFSGCNCVEVTTFSVCVSEGDISDVGNCRRVLMLRKVAFCLECIQCEKLCGAVEILSCHQLWLNSAMQSNSKLAIFIAGLPKLNSKLYFSPSFLASACFRRKEISLESQAESIPHSDPRISAKYPIISSLPRFLTGKRRWLISPQLQ